MRTIDVTPELAEQTLVTLAAHLPVQIEIGRPLLVCRVGGEVYVMTVAGDWWVQPGRVERSAHLPDGRQELTCWTGRVELSRVIVR